MLRGFSKALWLGTRVAVIIKPHTLRETRERHVFWFSGSVLKAWFQSRRWRFTCFPLPLTALSKIRLIRTYLTSDVCVANLTPWLLHFAEIVFP